MPRRGLIENSPRDAAKIKHPRSCILLRGNGSEKLIQLASGEPPRQVHLEEAILRVDETRGIRKISACSGSYGGNTERIALDLRGLGES